MDKRCFERSTCFIESSGIIAYCEYRIISFNKFFNNSLPVGPILPKSAKNVISYVIETFVLAATRETFHLLPNYIIIEHRFDSVKISLSKMRVQIFYYLFIFSHSGILTIL